MPLPPSATASGQPQGQLKHQRNDSMLDGQSSDLRPTMAEVGETSSLENGQLQDHPPPGEVGHHGHGR